MLVENRGNYLITYNQALGLPLNSSRKIRFIINQVAQVSLKEVGMALVNIGITSCFVASPAIPTMVLISVGLIATNILLHGIRFYAEDKKNRLARLDYYCEDLKFLSKAMLWLNSVVFSFFDLTTRGVVVHEAGHAFAAHCLFADSKPSIEVFAGGGGITKYYLTKLTSLGEWVGAKQARMIVAAAGTAFVILDTVAILIIAHRIKDTHPNLYRYFITTVILNIFHHVIYALSSFWDNQLKGHDFIYLWKGGIHPLVAIITIIAIPLLVQGSLWLMHRNTHHEIKFQPIIKKLHAFN